MSTTMATTLRGQQCLSNYHRSNRKSNCGRQHCIFCVFLCVFKQRFDGHKFVTSCSIECVGLASSARAPKTTVLALSRDGGGHLTAPVLRTVRHRIGLRLPALAMKCGSVLRWLTHSGCHIVEQLHNILAVKIHAGVFDIYYMSGGMTLNSFRQVGWRTRYAKQIERKLLHELLTYHLHKSPRKRQSNQHESSLCE